MLFALDKDNNRIHIDSTKRSEDYFCPCCGSKMVLKMGDIKTHHFAHHSVNVCKDSWHYDMSEWHFNWQNMFPKECQEVVKVFDGEKHRADVLIEKHKIVFEFQHSPLAPEEFSERNDFYNKLGYKVIWIFDVEEQYQNELIDNYDNNKWSWKRPRRTFNYFNCKNKMVELYLQLSNEEPYLVKVIWCAKDDGMSRFITDGNDYCEESIVCMFDDVEEMSKNEFKLSELFDKLIELNTKDHTTYYFGCPISKTHKCASSDIDIPVSEYEEIMPCVVCNYECNGYFNGKLICKKRFMDLNLDMDTVVRIESRDKDGFVNKLSYIENGVIKYVEIKTFKQNVAKNIFRLWDDSYCIVTFKNIRTGNYIRINQNPINQLLKYRRVYGWFSKDKYSFPKKTCELYGVDKEEWVIDWYRKK